MNLVFKIYFIVILVFVIFFQDGICGSLPFSTIKITTDYGPRIHPNTGLWNIHYGIDFAASKDTPIFAVESGKIVEIKFHPKMGYHIVLEGKSGKWTYMHLFDNKENYTNKFSLYKSSKGELLISRVLFEKWTEKTFKYGTYVEEGEPIAPTGNTGRGTGYHLHLSVSTIDGKKYNPLYCFPDMGGEIKSDMGYPKNNETVYSMCGQDAAAPLTCYTDASSGKNLDKVIVKCDGKEVYNTCFGGYPKEEEKNVVPFNEKYPVIDSIRPVAGKFIDCYYIMNGFNWKDAGQHNVSIETVDIKGNRKSNTFSFVIKDERWTGVINGVEFVWDDAHEKIIENKPFNVQINSGRILLNEIGKTSVVNGSNIIVNTISSCGSAQIQTPSGDNFTASGGFIFHKLGDKIYMDIGGTDILSLSQRGYCLQQSWLISGSSDSVITFSYSDDNIQYSGNLTKSN